MKWKFALEMAAGLNYIHTRQPPIVHRDLKVSFVFFLYFVWIECPFSLSLSFCPFDTKKKLKFEQIDWKLPPEPRVEGEVM